jgi:hypothetical protein
VIAALSSGTWLPSGDAYSARPPRVAAATCPLALRSVDFSANVASVSLPPRRAARRSTDVSRHPRRLLPYAAGSEIRNVCTAGLCRDRDRKAKHFLCFYHGWIFGNDGKLIDLPAERATTRRGSCRCRGLSSTASCSSSACNAAAKRESPSRVPQDRATESIGRSNRGIQWSNSKTVFVPQHLDGSQRFGDPPRPRPKNHAELRRQACHFGSR